MIRREVIDQAVQDARVGVVESFICKKCGQSRAEAAADQVVRAGYTWKRTILLIEHFKLAATEARARTAKGWDPDWINEIHDHCQCDPAALQVSTWAQKVAALALEQAVSSN